MYLIRYLISPPQPRLCNCNKTKLRLQFTTKKGTKICHRINIFTVSSISSPVSPLNTLPIFPQTAASWRDFYRSGFNNNNIVNHVIIMSLWFISTLFRSIYIFLHRTVSGSNLNSTHANTCCILKNINPHP